MEHLKFNCYISLWRSNPRRNILQITRKTYCGETHIQQCGITLKFRDTAAATELHKKAFRDTALKIEPHVKFTHRGSIVTQKKKNLEPKANKVTMYLPHHKAVFTYPTQCIFLTINLYSHVPHNVSP